MEAAERVIVECPHCGALHDVAQVELARPVLSLRCSSCRKVYVERRGERGPDEPRQAGAGEGGPRI
jgi:transposase-like protein